ADPSRPGQLLEPLADGRCGIGDSDRPPAIVDDQFILARIDPDPQWFACCHARFSRLRWMSLSGPPALACNGWSVRAPGPADGFPIGAVGGAGQISSSLCHWPEARLVPRPDRQTIQARHAREAA